jgi:enterochelin esterase-like enzyme
MKTKSWKAGLLLLVSVAGLWAWAPGPGRVLEGQRWSSAILGREVRYAVYLPPGYETGARRYPVVYLLHGFTDDESAWIQFGEIDRLADEAIARSDIPPLIIVMPDAGVTWYINDAGQKARYEDMFLQEFIPHIDASFRTRPDREFRGVAGLSMGGWGALMFTLRHPDVFAAAAGLSAAVWTDAQIEDMKPEEYDLLFGSLFGERPVGRDRLNAHFRSYHPLDLARSLPEESLRKSRYYLDCGDDDFLFEGNAALHVVLLRRRIPHEFRVRDGTHSWPYWRSGVIAALEFLARDFHRE